MLLLLICKQLPQHFVRENLTYVKMRKFVFRKSNEEINLRFQKLHRLYMKKYPYLVPTCKIKTTDRKIKKQKIPFVAIGSNPPPPPYCISSLCGAGTGFPVRQLSGDRELEPVITKGQRASWVSLKGQQREMVFLTISLY